MKVWSTGKFLKEDFGVLNENKKLKIRKLYSMIVPIIFKYSIFYDPSKISFISKSKFIKFENSSDKFELKLSREMVGWINDKFFPIMYNDIVQYYLYYYNHGRKYENQASQNAKDVILIFQFLMEDFHLCLFCAFLQLSVDKDFFLCLNFLLLTNK